MNEHDKRTVAIVFYISVGVFFSILMIPHLIKFSAWVVEQSIYVNAAVIAVMVFCLLLSPIILRKVVLK